MEHLLSSFGYVALILLTFAEAACVPIPSEVTLGAAGYIAASSDKMEIVAVIIVATVGELLGSFVGWSIGRYGGRPLIEKLGRFVLLTPADLDKSEAWFAKRGEPAVFVGRILPVIRTFISLPAGVAEMKPVRFGLATLAGSAVWCTAIAITGYELGKKWNELTKGFSDAGYVLAAIAVVMIGVFLFHRVKVVRSARAAEGAAAGGPAGGAGGR